MARRGCRTDLRARVQVCLGALLLLPLGMQAGTITWTGADSSSYNDPGNWTPGVIPNNTSMLSYDVTVDTPGGTDVVQLNAGPVTVNSLTLGVNSTSSTFSTGANSITFGSPTSTMAVLTIGGQGVLNVQTGGVAVVDTTAISQSLFPAASNAGSINVADGGTLTFRDSNGAPAGSFLENDGTITIGAGTSGSLVLDNGASPGTTFDVFTAGTGAINLNAGASISGATGSESLINDAGHTINVTSGTATISNLASFTNGLSAAATINVGTTSTPAALVIDTTNGGVQGSFSNTGFGSINVADGAQLVFKNTNPGPTGVATFNNDGTIALGTSAGAALVLNGAGTTFDITSTIGGTVSMTGTSSIYGQTGSESLINDVGHTISNSGTGSFYGLTAFTNNGTLSAVSGTLNVETSANLTNWTSGSKTLTGGSYTVASGAVLELAAIGSGGITTLSGANVSVTGTGLLSGDGKSDAIRTVTSINDSNLSLSGVGTKGAAYAFGNLTVSADSSASVAAVCGPVSSFAGSTLCVQNQSYVSATGLTLSGQSQVSVVNGDLLVGASAAEATSVTGQVVVDGTGAVDIGEGAKLELVNADGSAGTLYLNGGTLTGGGTLEANLDQVGGTLNPGDPQAFGISGNYTLSAGMLDFDLAGLGAGDYDQIHVGGDVTLEGSLDVTLDDSFTPMAGDVFTDVLDWGQGSAPAELTYFDSALDLNFSLVQDAGHANEFDLDVTTASATPEPGTLSLLFGAMMIASGAAWRLRRRGSASVN